MFQLNQIYDDMISFKSIKEMFIRNVTVCFNLRKKGNVSMDESDTIPASKVLYIVSVLHSFVSDLISIH